MIFNQSNPPPGYYVYLFVRRDGTPYYVGKGQGNRAWNKRKKTSAKLPSDRSRIIIIHWDISEIEAFMLERYYIRWFGRKDIGTGILRNLTDGGDGCSGRKGVLNSKYDRTKLSWVNLLTGVSEQLTGHELLLRYQELRPADISYIKSGNVSKHWRLDGPPPNGTTYDYTVYEWENVETGKREVLCPLTFRDKYPHLTLDEIGKIKRTNRIIKKWRRFREITDPLHPSHIEKKPDIRKGRPRPEVSGVNSPTYDPTIYEWTNLKTNECFQSTRLEFIQATGIKRGSVTDHIRGKHKSCCGWRAEKILTNIQQNEFLDSEIDSISEPHLKEQW